MSRVVVALLIILSLRNYDCSKNTDVNGGTVLFTESDTTKDCWNSDNIALLTSRMLLEDVLPSPCVLEIHDNAFVTDIIDYFHLILEVVRQLTYGKTKHIMLLALTDTLGGYLHAYVLPIARHSFYAGYIDFESMDKLYQLFNELKCFLRTNGGGWSKPVQVFCKHVQPKPLTIPKKPSKCNPCQGLVFYKKPCSDGKQGITIPLPFFDSKTNPTAIAVPFKTYSLRSMESKSASYVILKFYVAASKCLTYRNSTKADIKEFNSNLLSWIHIHVKPHLMKDKFYAAFGGVLRVLATLKQKGARPINNKEIGSFNIMPESEVTNDEEKPKKKSSLILMALLTTIFIWFCLGSIFICYRVRAAKGRCECNDPPPPTKSNSCTKTSSKSSSKFCCASSKSKNKSTSEKSTKKSSCTSIKSGSQSVCSACCSEVSNVSKKGAKKNTSCSSACPAKSKKNSQESQCRCSKTTSKESTKCCAVTCTYPQVLPEKYLMSSSEERSRQPFVFGYDLESSISDESTPRGQEVKEKKVSKSD